MARDLEQVRQPVRQAGQPVSEEKPEPKPVRVAQPASPKTAQQEAPASTRLGEAGPKSRDEARGDERRDEQRLSDILRIARQRVEAPVLPKELADILPIEPPLSSRPTAPLEQARLPGGQAVVAPPSDLPTEERLDKQKEPIREPQGKTPEEILGLPARQAGRPTPQADLPTRPASTPSRSGQAVQTKLMRPVSPGGLKFPFIAGALALAFIAISGGIYWNFFLRGQSPPPPSQPSGPAEPQAPQALIGYDKRQILEIGELTYDTVKPQIDGLLGGEFLPDSLVYVPVKLSSDTEIKYLTLADLLTALRIDAPPAFYTTGYQDFSLFLYSPGEEEKSACKEAEIADASCHGPRMGLVIKLPLPKENAVFSLMREWEKTIAADLRPLMGAVPRQRVAGDTFSLGRYGDFTTHFVNLPISAISVDWILTDTHLVIATSKNAARRAVDKLQ